MLHGTRNLLLLARPCFARNRLIPANIISSKPSWFFAAILRLLNSIVKTHIFCLQSTNVFVFMNILNFHVFIVCPFHCNLCNPKNLPLQTMLCCFLHALILTSFSHHHRTHTSAVQHHGLNIFISNLYYFYIFTRVALIVTNMLFGWVWWVVSYCNTCTRTKTILINTYTTVTSKPKNYTTCHVRSA